MIPAPSLLRWIERHRNRVNALVFDIDGVLVSHGKRLAGSRRLIDRLHAQLIPYILLTNDGNHSPQEKASRLAHAGLSIDSERIVSCGHGLKPLAQKQGFESKRFFVSGDTGRPCYVDAAGIVVERDPSRIADCQGVIVGEENYDWERNINAIVNFFIASPNAPLVVLNPDVFYPGRHLTIHVAAGGITHLIVKVLSDYGINVSPTYLGKPHEPIFRLAHRRLEKLSGQSLDMKTLLMVGDNLDADVRGARQCSMQTALMLTGVTSMQKLRQAPIAPDLLFEAL